MSITNPVMPVSRLGVNFCGRKKKRYPRSRRLEQEIWVHGLKLVSDIRIGGNVHKPLAM